MTPGAVVADLMRSGAEPVGLEVVRPSLEDVYLGLVAAHDASTSEREELENAR